MKVVVKKWGNSAAVRIPAALIETVSLRTQPGAMTTMTRDVPV